jgi:glycosyltransferase involved in cell wall biosynthesis
VQPFVESQVASLAAAGIVTDVWNLGSGRHGWHKYVHGLRRVRARVRERPYDLVHAHFAFCGWVARAQVGLPVVVSFLGDDLLGRWDVDGRVTLAGRVGPSVNRLLARLSDAAIVKSQGMARRLTGLRRVYVIPNGVDVEAFQPIDRVTACRQLGWDSRHRHVLFGADPLLAVKNFPLAEAAVRALQAVDRRPVRLVTMGAVPPAAVPVYLSAADVLLVTSFSEGSPNIVKEALACNLPVVSVDVGDVRDLLAGVAGAAICDRNPAALASGVRRALDAPRPESRHLLIERGLTARAIADRIAAVYRDVLSSRGRATGRPSAA